MKPDRVPRRNPLSADLDWVLARLERPLSALRGRRIFITGGTGFIGTWLLECLAWANQHMDLRVSALILSRNPESFLEKKPHLALNPGFRFHQGDVQHFDFSLAGDAARASPGEYGDMHNVYRVQCTRCINVHRNVYIAYALMHTAHQCISQRVYHICIDAHSASICIH